MTTHASTTTTKPLGAPDPAQLQQRAQALRLAGLLAHWDAVQGDPARLSWTRDLLGWEKNERARRSLERRLRSAHIGRFKPLADFDWDWPTHCDRAAVQELMTLSFMADATNVVLVGPNVAGKSMLACNLGHQALIEGRTVLFTTAGQLLGDLSALDSDSTLRRRLLHYSAPDLLLIDEVGYLSYSNRHADFAGELISRCYENKSTMVTTNRSLQEWHEVFPNAACVVSLIDRLVHRCRVVPIKGKSYRLKEAKERAEKKSALRGTPARKVKKS